ncbi:hypothetical protein VNO77_04385 [Canavalia gladiata]|uniref:Uncharacterized protein n=1 Tax=Canavalia gladiata TaxID=3824 RepID=A0AAN9MWE9_CANGL
MYKINERMLNCHPHPLPIVHETIGVALSPYESSIWLLCLALHLFASYGACMTREDSPEMVACAGGI